MLHFTEDPPGLTEMWSYYFFDLPIAALKQKFPSHADRIRKLHQEEIAQIYHGYEILCRSLKKPYIATEADEIIKKALLVKIVGESDAYSPLRMSKKHLDRYFTVRGMENLSAALNSERPIVLLSAHTGSFVISPIALQSAGIPIYVIARKFSYASEAHPAKQLYLSLYHKLLNMRFPVHFIYTDFSGNIDRTLMSAFQKRNIIFTLIDLPRTFYPYKRLPVSLCNSSSSLPAGFLQWSLRKKAVFLTMWNTIDLDPSGRFMRTVTIDPAIKDGLQPQEILQVYADRLSSLIVQQPWQWISLQILDDYIENN